MRTSHYRVLRLALVAVLLCVAAASAVRADIVTAGNLLVNLDASALPVGELTSWANTGTLGGTFGGSTQNPVVGNVLGVKAVTFALTETAPVTGSWLKSDFLAAAEFTGQSDWSVEIWAQNPSIGADEGMLTWTQRGEENMNAACCYSTAPVWGAFAGWGAGDLGYGKAIAPAAGIWHHIAYTYTGGATGTLTIYVDGVQNNQATKSLNIHGPGDTVETPVILGGAVNGDALGLDAIADNQWFTGSLSKIRIHDNVLTAEQVKANYDTEKAPYLGGVLVVTEPASKALNFGMMPLEDGQTAAKTVIVKNDGTADITFNTPAVSLTGANADQFVIVTQNFDTTPMAPGTTRTVEVAYDPSVKGNHVAQLAFSSNSPLPTTVDLSGLGGKPDALVTAGDLLVNLNSKNLTAGVLQTWTNAGTLGGEFVNPSAAYPTVENVNGVKAVTFNTTWLKSDFLTTPDFTGDSNWSLETWLFDSSVPDEQQVVTWSNRGEENKNAALLYGSNANWGAFGGWGAGDCGYLNATPPVQGKWHQITITYAGGAGSLLKIYVDGALNNSKTMSLNIHGQVPGDGEAMPIMLGGSTGNDPLGLDAVVSGWWYTGSIAAVRFHGGELTADQVFSNYMFEKGDYMFPALALDSPAVPSLSFGSVALDAGSVEKTLTLRNSGENTLVFANPAFTLSGTDSALFSVVTPPPASLPVGATCEVKIAFDPDAAGAKAAQITFQSNADPLSVDLIGFGGSTATVQTAGDLLVNLDPSGLSDGPLAAWANTGTLGGNFTPLVDLPSVESVAGIRQVKFVNPTGSGDYLLSDWYTPASITGSEDYSFEVWAMNPAIASEEVLVSWAIRGGPAGTAAQVNYGSSPDFGATTHWDTPDMGYLGGAPAAQQWHHIVVTYSGSTGGVPGTEKVYVDGVLNNQEKKVLAIHAEADGYPMPMYLGTAIEAAGTANAGISYSGSLGRIRVHAGQLTAAQVLNNYVADAPNYAAPTVKVVKPTAGTVFPAQAVSGTTAPETIEVQNIGLTSLVFTAPGFAITGTDADQFALVTPVDTTDVLAGTTRTVQVVF
ncbi:MAG TPA: choice-of-anchor D domain-containing protein, partial [Candidatus Sumerlaeota bacterium]|nr:choice-of-anchor D domain-containing protein [Candidatus Sumerlaeota bacterium]